MKQNESRSVDDVLDKLMVSFFDVEEVKDYLPEAKAELFEIFKGE